MICPIERKRQAADLADSLGNRVGHPEELIGLLIEQQLVVAKMRSAHVPVEILGLHIQREDIREDGVQRGGHAAARHRFEMGRGE